MSKKVAWIKKEYIRKSIGNKKVKETAYILVAEKPDGQKIAFAVDTGGK